MAWLPPRRCSLQWAWRGAPRRAGSTTSKRRWPSATLNGEHAWTSSARRSRDERRLNRQALRPRSHPTFRRQSQPGRPTRSTGLALARIEARLGEFGERLKEAQSSPNQSDPSIEELRRDVERLRNETEARAQSTRQETHELGLVVQEVLQLLRGLASRPWGPDQMQGPVPGARPRSDV